MKLNNNLSELLLRLGLAFAFAYAAIASFVNPTSWLGFFPAWMTGIIPGSILLQMFSVLQIIIAVWLLSGWKVFYAASIYALMVLGIVVFNIGAMDIVFRDVTIFFAAVALAAMAYSRR
ncbi:hypothetical protein J4475_01905 [Candidatus Woesearchaeota archaeon]|nr:hypothetical protein [Candidatus Woesearchaeota archaeon]